MSVRQAAAVKSLQCNPAINIHKEERAQWEAEDAARQAKKSEQAYIDHNDKWETHPGPSLRLNPEGVLGGDNEWTNRHDTAKLDWIIDGAPENSRLERRDGMDRRNWYMGGWADQRQRIFVPCT